jgi:hypothetical protein
MNEHEKSFEIFFEFEAKASPEPGNAITHEELSLRVSLRSEGLLAM